MSLNSVVLPVPLRPTTPQRSPAATVNVMSVNSVVAPNSTAAPLTAICVMRPLRCLPGASCRQPARPCGLRRADRQGIAMTHQRDLEQQGLVYQDLHPSLVAVARRAQRELGKSPRALVDECLHAELL